MREWNGEALEKQITTASNVRSQWTATIQPAAVNPKPAGSR